MKNKIFFYEHLNLFFLLKVQYLNVIFKIVESEMI